MSPRMDLGGTTAHDAQKAADGIGGGPIPDGCYLVAVQDVKVEDFKGDEAWNLTLTVLVGDYASQTLYDTLYWGTKGAGKIVACLTALGLTIPSGEVTYTPDPLKDKQAYVIVRREPKKDGSGDRPRVKGWSKTHLEVKPLEQTAAPTPAAQPTAAKTQMSNGADLPWE